jgi:MFS family permease
LLPTDEPRAKLPHGLRALALRDFRIYLLGQGTSQIGNWVQLIATSWLVFRLTGSPLMVGVATFALQIPYLVIAPFAGVLIDRLDVRRVLYVTNVVAVVQSLAMLALVALGRIEVWHVVAGNIFLGVANSCESPARQALLGRLVRSRADLPNAIALNSSMMTGARFAGPMLSGSVIAAFGVAAGFATGSLLRFAVMYALHSLRFDGSAAPRNTRHWGQELVGGVRFAFGFLPTRNILCLLACTSFLVQAYQPLLPWFASVGLRGGPETLGWLTGAAGLGALTGMIYLATRRDTRALPELAGRSSMLAALALIGFALSGALWLALPMMYLVGMGMMLTGASTNTMLQTVAPDELRGRVASLYIVALMGIAPVGGLAGGALAEWAGAPATLVAFGAAAVLASAVYHRQLPRVRQAIQRLP